jgi:hypothetical protein
LGSHLVTPRRGYLHHGIYVGDGMVVHYAGLATGLHRGPVEEVPLARFTGGRPVWVKSQAPSSFQCPEVIQRARSRVGEDCYRLLTNNCEHFCEWCLHGEHRSYQVEALLARVVYWKNLPAAVFRTVPPLPAAKGATFAAYTGRTRKSDRLLGVLLATVRFVAQSASVLGRVGPRPTRAARNA